MHGPLYMRVHVRGPQLYTAQRWHRLLASCAALSIALQKRTLIEGAQIYPAFVRRHDAANSIGVHSITTDADVCASFFLSVCLDSQSTVHAVSAPHDVDDQGLPLGVLSNWARPLYVPTNLYL